MFSSRRLLFTLAAATTTGVLVLTPVGLHLTGALAGQEVVTPVGAGAGTSADPAVVDAPGPAPTGAARTQGTSRTTAREPLDQGALVARAEQRAEALAAVQERVGAEEERLDAEAEQAAEERAAQERSLGYDPDETDPRAIARQLAERRFGWDGADQWTCIDRLITQESSWDPRAVNPSSGAYGLVQSLPAEKMASAGDDWRTNPGTQLEWGFGYIEERYGTPCDAWSFHQANNWY